MSQSQIVRAPKRAIERRVSEIVANNVTTVVQTNVLHTVTEKETLIRTLIEGEIVYAGTTASSRLNSQIHIEPNGQQVATTLGTAERLDEAEPIQLIARKKFVAELSSDIGVKTSSTWMQDIKAQRKLNPGDLISQDLVTSSDTGQFDVYITITQWFKQT